MTDITVLGDVNLDVLSPPLDSLPEKEQLLLENLKIKAGGGAANFAVAAAELGMKVKLIGSVGEDEIGNLVIRLLKRENLKLAIKKLQTRTGISFSLQFSNGTKKLFTFRGNNAVFSLKDFSLQEIEGDFLQVFGYNFMDGLRKDLEKVFEHAKENQMVVGLDPDIKAGRNFDLESFKRALKYVDVLFLNEDEAKEIGIKQSDVRTLVIKRGKNGCMGIENGEKVEVEGLKVEVKNPTGAGDVFDAAFVHHYFYGYDLRECLEFAQQKAVEYLASL